MNIEKLEKDLIAKKESYWLKRGEQRALDLFQQMARRVPAYKKFLKQHKLDPKSIKTIADFPRVPLISKENYLKKYPYQELFWDGQVAKGGWTYSSTSGTTGEPFFFPRTIEQDQQYALSAELYLRHNFKIHKRSTLYINGFAMGPWIGGVFTYEAIRILSQRGGYDLSIVNAGVNKNEIIKTIKKLGKQFDQVIIAGYPPFVKDTVDAGTAQGLNWKDYKIGFVFSAEGFSEGFRDYVLECAGIKEHLFSSLNHYGTVDLGTMSHETPAAILLRRLALKNPKMEKELFGMSWRQPTLTQYLPELFYFEQVDGNLICSAASGIPLVRYDLKDRGGLLSSNQLKKQYKKELRKVGDVWNLPFVHVLERSDMVVSWYGANVYPEHVKEAHYHRGVRDNLTGKFNIRVIESKGHNSVFEIHSELRSGSKHDKKLIKQLKKVILEVLMLKNSEFRNSYNAIAKKNRDIRVILHENQSAPHFIAGGKQKWVTK